MQECLNANRICRPVAEKYVENQQVKLLKAKPNDLFSALQSSTERVDTEFQSARGGVANTQGGTIVLGVAEKPARLVWKGVPDAARPTASAWMMGPLGATLRSNSSKNVKL
ncbi:hypothetical protein [Rhodoferax ferrireducens]|uniref:hypothetical protein n=1 Tax=Rhodoferax ferrireducens TaxID=192843 RepID=UPI003BB568B3